MNLSHLQQHAVVRALELYLGDTRLAHAELQRQVRLLRSSIVALAVAWSGLVFLHLMTAALIGAIPLALLGGVWLHMWSRLAENERMHRALMQRLVLTEHRI